MTYVVWILTKEVNAYDQYGEYFVSSFGRKPTHQQLAALGVPTNRLRHVLNGGGRVDRDDEWFHLRPRDIGVPHDPQPEVKAEWIEFRGRGV